MHSLEVLHTLSVNLYQSLCLYFYVDTLNTPLIHRQKGFKSGKIVALDYHITAVLTVSVFMFQNTIRHIGGVVYYLVFSYPVERGHSLSAFRLLLLPLFYHKLWKVSRVFEVFVQLNARLKKIDSRKANLAVFVKMFILIFGFVNDRNTAF
jgi:hypothetical protein